MDDRFVRKMNENGVFAMESAKSGSVKRSRTPSSGIQVASCLVDGCNSDLSKCKDYHRRHKVCEFHSKTPKVIVKGHEQRFCQQCSRFHSLEEFDEGKRSCRKRLDGHNRRRRKPQPESLHITSARLLSQYQGTKILAFDHQQILPSGPVLNCNWGVPAKSETDHVAFKFDSRNGSSNGESLSNQGQRQRQFSFLHGYSSASASASSASELNQDSHFTSENNGGITQKAFSNCARSLLSSSSPPQTREVGFRHMNTRPNAVPPPLHFDAHNTRSDNTNLNCEGMFDFVSDASCSNGVPHRLFSWE